jgi:hypothetical protein
MPDTVHKFRRSQKLGRQNPDRLSKPGRDALRTTRAAKQQHFMAVAPNVAVSRRFALLRRSISLLIKGALVGVLLSCLTLAAAMLWALYYVPLEMRAASDPPSLLMEAANGEPLGRVGPLGDAVNGCSAGLKEINVNFAI